MLNLILPGHSTRNREELKSISSFLSEKDLEVTAHEWLHWQDETLKFDMDSEIELVLSEIKGRDKVGIIAKSIGTRVAVNLLDVMQFEPVYLLLMGLPIKRATEKTRNLYLPRLKNYSGKIFVVQNEKDPLGSIQDVQNFLQGIDYTEFVVENSTHRYNYPELVFNIVSDVLNKEND
ncbi:MAG: hypothetical protein KatS3mg085_170 [Candidatus Dojkabacteria bacterium]|nr:MAG: hypothetical protein KatS3mg085_170 [Candidatus Dojkabacteria bacterium]